MNVHRSIIIVLVILCACSKHGNTPTVVTGGDTREVTALRETVPVGVSDDAADDPAIWVNPEDPRKSLVLGTNKKKGLEVYDLDGRRVQLLSTGNVNNVDIRQEVRIGNELMDLAIATNRTTNMLDVYRIHGKELRVEQITELGIQLEITEPYGMCLYKPENEEGLHVFANGKDGTYQHWYLNQSPELLGEFHLDSQPEGCVADDKQQVLYIGEEDLGFWKIDLSSPGYIRKLVDKTGTERLTADVEGITLYEATADTGYIVVSSQGNNTYAVYRREGDNEYVGSFKIVDSPTSKIDGTSETDGISVNSQLKTPTFPQGLLVVQDGNNTMPPQKQDFKYVSWKDVSDALGLRKM